MSGFVEVARDAFAFLERENGFSVKDCSDDDGGGHVTYVNVNNGIAVKSLYEFSNAFVFVFIYRLIDGQLRDNVLPITDDSEINCFDFNDALTEDQKMKPAYEYGDESVYYDEENGLRNYVTEFATRLKENGGRLLSGDFSMLSRMETTIKQRAHDLDRERR